MTDSRRIAKFSMLFVGIVGAYSIADTCFRTVTSGLQCCPNTRMIGCTDGENFWNCVDTKTAGAGPWTPTSGQSVTAANPNGNVDLITTTLGSCTYAVTYSCGTVPGECIAGGPANITCTSTVAGGNTCNYSSN